MRLSPPQALHRSLQALLLLGCAAMTSTAAAQTQDEPLAVPPWPSWSAGHGVLLRTLPDLDLELLTTTGQDPSEPLRVGMMTGGRGWLDPGSDALGGAEAQVGAALGAWRDPVTWVRVKTDVRAPIVFGDDERDTIDAARLEGHHAARGVIGLGGLEKGSAGIDLEAQVRLDHDVSGPGATLRPELGYASYRDLDLTLRLRPRFNTRSGDSGFLSLGTRPEATAFMFPLTWRYRVTDYTNEGPVGWVETQEFSGAYGHIALGRQVADGSIEYIGLTYTRVTLTPSRGVCLPYDTRLATDCEARLEAFRSGSDDPDATPPWTHVPLRLEGYTLKFVNMRGLAVDHDGLVLSLKGLSLGFSLLWNPDSSPNGGSPSRQGSSPHLDVAASIHSRYVELGAATSFDITHTPDGGELVPNWHSEGLVVARSPSWKVGVSGRIVYDVLLDSPNDDVTKRGISWLATEVEAFARLSPDMQVGVVHQANQGPQIPREAASWDLWAYPEGWTQQLGVFARVRRDLQP
ncbi:MAG: hypothetical protein CMH57_05425 [Myxococcales bacterium]|nr:hypothetical protein [Myxococcales bacterium]